MCSPPSRDSSWPGPLDGLDADRFDEYCDHLLVREDNSGELVGCYRMLPPPGAIAAGGLYTATEFDVEGLDPLRPSLVEMGRAVVREDHRNGGVVLLMWAGILAYLDRCGYDYVTGCVSVPVQGSEDEAPGSQIRGVRDFVRRRHAAPAEYTVYPYRPVTRRRQRPRRHRPAGPGERAAADARLPAAGRAGMRRTGPRSRLRGRRFPCPAGQTPGRHPLPAQAAVGRGGGRDGRGDVVVTIEHPWVPRATCDASCVHAGRRGRSAGGRRVAHRGAGDLRGALAVGDAIAGHPDAGSLAHPTGLLPNDAALPRRANHGVRRADSQPARCAGGQRPRVLGGHLRDRRRHARQVRRQRRTDRLARPRECWPA